MANLSTKTKANKGEREENHKEVTEDKTITIMGLQKDYTTPEQSKRLLELGVPKWTANVKYDSVIMFPSLVQTLCFCDTGIEDDGYEKYTIEYSPSWSVGRLCEIVSICYVSKLPCTCYPVGARNIVQYMVDSIAYMAYNGLLDFSKL